MCLKYHLTWPLFQEFWRTVQHLWDYSTPVSHSLCLAFPPPHLPVPSQILSHHLINNLGSFIHEKEFREKYYSIFFLYSNSSSILQYRWILYTWFYLSAVLYPAPYTHYLHLSLQCSSFVTLPVTEHGNELCKATWGKMLSSTVNIVFAFTHSFSISTEESENLFPSAPRYGKCPYCRRPWRWRIHDDAQSKKAIWDFVMKLDS